MDKGQEIVLAKDANIFCALSFRLLSKKNSDGKSHRCFFYNLEEIIFYQLLVQPGVMHVK
jgi:hypothetical protein